MGKSLNRTMPAFRTLEINFYQKSSPKLSLGIIGVVALVMFSVLGFSWLGWSWMSASKEWGTTNIQLTQIKTQMLTATNQIKASEKDSSSLLLSLPSQIRSARIETTVMLDKLSVLIPQEVNISSLGFGEDGSTLKVTGLFASSEALISFEQAVRDSTEFKLLRMKELSKVNGDAKDPNNGHLAALQATFELQYPAKVTEPIGKGGS
jgi:Tfp pilus assembly protein PilN